VGSRLLQDLTVTWLGIEPVTGCEPIPNLTLFFNLAGFLATSFVSGFRTSFAMEIPR
jgi:hypothetical protein